MAGDGVTYIRISTETESRLDDRKGEGMSYDELIARLLDETADG